MNQGGFSGSGFLRIVYRYVCQLSCWGKNGWRRITEICHLRVIRLLVEQFLVWALLNLKLLQGQRDSFTPNLTTFLFISSSRGKSSLKKERLNKYKKNIKKREAPFTTKFENFTFLRHNFYDHVKITNLHYVQLSVKEISFYYSLARASLRGGSDSE